VLLLYDVKNLDEYGKKLNLKATFVIRCRIHFLRSSRKAVITQSNALNFLV